MLAQSGPRPPITADNAADLQLVDTLGLGMQTSEIAYSPDGSQIAILSLSTGIWVAPADLSTPPRQIDPQASLHFAFTPDGLLALPKFDRIDLIDLTSGEVQVSFPQDSDHFYTAKVHPTESILAVVRDDGLVTISDMDSGTVLHTLHMDASAAALFGMPFLNAHFNADGSLLVAATTNQAVLWNWDAETVIGSYTGAMIMASAFLPDDTLLFASAASGTLTHWNPVNQQTVRLESTVAEIAVAASPDGSMVVGTGDGGMTLWPTPLNPDEPQDIRFEDEPEPIMGAAFSPDGSQIAYVHRNGSVGLWDVASGQRVASLPSTGPIFDLAFLPNGQQLVVGESGRISLWDIPSHQIVLQQTTSPAIVQQFSIKDTGSNQLISYFNFGAFIWSLSDNVIVHPDDNYSQIVFLPEERGRVAATVVNNIEIQNSENQVILTIETNIDGITDIAVDPVHQWVAAGGQGGEVIIWDMQTGSLLNSWILPDGVSQLVFNAARGFLAAGSADGKITLWHVETDTQLMQQTISRNPVLGMAFNSDGTLLAVPGDDGVIGLFDTGTSNLLWRWQSNLYALVAFTGIDFSPDDTMIAVSSLQNTIYLFGINN